MPRIICILIALAGAYLTDRAAFDGRYFRESVAAANDMANQFNSEVRDFLRPLGR